MASLKIDSAQINDVGNYVAVGENEAGKDQTQCNVYVKSAPVIDTTPTVHPDAFKYLEHHAPQKAREDEGEPKVAPKVVVPLSNVKLNEGQGVFLACKITGSPKPKVNLIYNLIKK